MEYNFLIFISDKNSNIIKKKEKNRKKFINRIFRSCVSFDLSRKHFEQTGKIKFILNDEVDNFLKNKNIYFDTDSERIPRYDILYLKVNEHFFINEEKYFDKITEYYFNLYCNVFSKLGLKNIHLSTNSDISEDNKYNGGLNIYAGNISAEIEYNNKTVNNKNFNRDFSNSSLFKKEIEKYSQLKNDDEKNQHIYNYLTKNKYGDSIVYKDSLKLDLIKQRIENLNLLSFSEKISFENSITSKISLNLSEFITTFDIGFNINLENHSSTKNDFTLIFEFYDVKVDDVKIDNIKVNDVKVNEKIDDIKVNDVKVNDVKVNDVKVNEVKVNDVKVNEVKIDDIKVNDVKVNEVKVNDVKIDDIKVNDVKVDDVKVNDVKVNDVKVDDNKPKELLPINIVQTHISLFSGPWPCDCDEIESFICYERDLDRIINDKIRENPRRNIIEIVTEVFNYRVKVWKIKDDKKPNIIISNGIRHMKWDNNNIEHFDTAIETLKRNGFY